MDPPSPAKYRVLRAPEAPNPAKYGGFVGPVEFGLPEAKFGLPEVEFGLPEAKFGLPEAKICVSGQ